MNCMKITAVSETFDLIVILYYKNPPFQCGFIKTKSSTRLKFNSETIVHS